MKKSTRKRYRAPGWWYVQLILYVAAILLTGFGLGYVVGTVRANAAAPDQTMHLTPIKTPVVYAAPADKLEVVEYVEPETVVTDEAPELQTLPSPAADPKPAQEEPPYSEEDLEALALIIYQEAGADYCSDETRRMVGTVVLNRVASEYFPNTVTEVATQYLQYGRLYWTGIVWPDRASEACEAHAVQRAYDCAEALLMGERAFDEGVIYQAEFPQGTETVAHVDGIYFCK